MTDRINMDLRCHRCRMFAYVDRFEGEYTEIGYECGKCIRLRNYELMEAVKKKNALEKDK